MDLMEIKQLTKRWNEHFLAHYDGYGNDIKEQFIDELIEIFLSYKSSGLADKNFIQGILSFNSASYYQRLSEMMTYAILRDRGYDCKKPGTKNTGGPDYEVTSNKIKAHVELITPEPDAYIRAVNECKTRRLNPKASAVDFFIKRSLLKMTSAVNTKSEQYLSYLNKNITSKDTPTVIAINDWLLQPQDFPQLGISNMVLCGSDGEPLVSHVLFGVRKTRWVIESGRISKVEKHVDGSLRKRNGKLVSTDSFLHEQYSHISGIIYFTLNESYVFQKIFSQKKELLGSLAFSPIYIPNPNANNKLASLDGFQCVGSEILS